jgi:Alanyl-tRNA synthetase
MFQTHVSNTSEIGLFKILKEEGIGSGTRRIIALTGQKAFEAFKEEEEILTEVSDMLKSPQASLTVDKLASLQAELRKLQKENEALSEKLASSQSEEVFKNIQNTGDVNFIAEQVNVKDASDLRKLADIWKQKDLSDVLVLTAAIGDKVNVLVASKNSDIKAGNLVKDLAAYVDGRGGGKPDMAMAGGSNPAGITELLEKVGEHLG